MKLLVLTVIVIASVYCWHDNIRERDECYRVAKYVKHHRRIFPNETARHAFIEELIKSEDKIIASFSVHCISNIHYGLYKQWNTSQFIGLARYCWACSDEITYPRGPVNEITYPKATTATCERSV
ncbi:unnamed protein product [Bursaphelenchus xylophilus]|uniref:(pine wood nematode) hypothetical protein n=1 Tax=Bursaphelenchus xylophilus TaxID=6326 RepID=A0A1I7SRY5_BURXY|nr:unnamed protein product [Bursaphelenchus xylophilus]CAG9101711.1 unnamed protein product [Bursaphelenchus xylophilus]